MLYLILTHKGKLRILRLIKMEFYQPNCIRLKDINAETLRLHMLDKYGVRVIALGKSNVNVAFSSMEEKQIPELSDRVLKGVEDLRAPGK
jgi:hypothetical protein